jgi:hypothetical protein
MGEIEYVACCPRCKTFETLWFTGDIMVPTRRFAQNVDGKVFHDCGAEEPCRLLPRFRIITVKPKEYVQT